MKYTLQLISLAIATFLLHGCTTLSKTECRHANWHTIGFNDGKRGVSLDYINKHIRACAKTNTPNLVAWKAGRKEGLKNYCTPINAYVVGRNGRELAPVCGFIGRSELIEMINEYENGRHKYQLENMLNDMQDRHKREHYRHLQK